MLGTVLVPRCGFRADTTDVLTDITLTLVAPLNARVVKLEAEGVAARRRAEAMQQEIAESSRVVDEVIYTVRCLRTAIFAPDATLEKIRDLDAILCIRFRG